MSLYNELRPQTLKDVVGQESTVKILEAELAKGIVHNAYLLVGERGTGKTTVARILAKSFNCEDSLDGCCCGQCDSCKEVATGTSMDVFELDAASNNSVQDIRGILEKVQFKPLRKKKVFILDEVHMLSNAASNALLKVLEEPPQDVVFILCTTERQKVLPTIISRCATYEFEKIPRALIEAHMAEICKDRGITAEPEALSVIAKAARGAMRDALSILDQFLSAETIRAEEVAAALGMITEDAVFTLLKAYASCDTATVIGVFRELTAKGCSLPYLIEEMSEVLLDTIYLRMTGAASDIAGTKEYVANTAELAQALSEDAAFRLQERLQDVYRNRTAGIETALLSALIQIVAEDTRLTNLETRLEAVEGTLANGIITVDAKAMAAESAENDGADEGTASEHEESVAEVAAEVGETELAESPSEVNDSEEALGTIQESSDGYELVAEFDCPFEEEPFSVPEEVPFTENSSSFEVADEPIVPSNAEENSSQSRDEKPTEVTPAEQDAAKAESEEPEMEASMSFDELMDSVASEESPELNSADEADDATEPEMNIFGDFARLFG